MKSLVDLCSQLLQDCGGRCGVHSVRDVKTLRDRSEHEGDSFITITLPSFGKDFDKALDLGRVSPGMFLSFRKERSGIPSFMKGFLSHVFGVDGVLLQEPSIDCICVIRQFCRFAQKLKLPCSPARERAAIDSYLKCDSELESVPENVQIRKWFKLVAKIISSRLDLTTEHLEKAAQCTAHGPGRTQERISGNQKWRFATWHDRLSNAGFPYWPFGRGSISELTAFDMSEWPRSVSPELEPPVRVVFVPKTLKSPRVIAVEPVCMQYAQQVLNDALKTALGKQSLTSGSVEFTDQGVNQCAAFLGSTDGNYATVDMKDASDRISVSHVRDAFECVPDFLELLLASRTTRAQLPNKEIISLRKFASMGSATCFPVEAYIFFISIIASRILTSGLFPTARLVRRAAQGVHVYGDDLIFPVDEAPSICLHLEALGFKVNYNKSFWNGKFRESCGKDFFDGHDVTPCYIRRLRPTDRTDSSGILSTVATSNQLYQAGYKRAANVLRKDVEKLVGLLPTVEVDSPAIGWVDDSDVVSPKKWDVATQRFLYKRLVAKPVLRADHLEGDPALAKCLRMIGKANLPVAFSMTEYLSQLDAMPSGLSDSSHLEESATPYAVTLKHRWVP